MKLEDPIMPENKEELEHKRMWICQKGIGANLKEFTRAKSGTI